MVGQRLSRFACKHGACIAAVQHETGRKLRPVDARLTDERQHLCRGPTVERRWLHRDEHEIGGEQRRTHQAGDARWPVDHDMIGIASEFGRLPVQRIAGEANDAEQAGLARMLPLLRPVERRSLRVRVDQRDALSLSCPFAGEVERQRRFADAASRSF